MRGTNLVAIVIIVVIMLTVVFILLLLSGKSATADMEAAIMETEQTPTPMPEIVTMESDEVNCEPIPFPKPMPTICIYDWESSTLDTFAKGMYGLDNWNEKYGYVLTAVNRYLSGAKNEKGAPLYGSATLEGIASCRAEYYFYNDHAEITDENRELANFMLNVAFTERFTCNFTGFAFPSNAVLFGYNEDHKPIVRSERGAEPFILNYDWKDVIPWTNQ